MSQSPIATISEFHESGDCDLCSKETDVVVATFRTAFPPDSHVCFNCLRKLVTVDHKHHSRRNGKLQSKPAPQELRSS